MTEFKKFSEDNVNYMVVEVPKPDEPVVRFIIFEREEDNGYRYRFVKDIREMPVSLICRELVLACNDLDMDILQHIKFNNSKGEEIRDLIDLGMSRTLMGHALKIQKAYENAD